MSECEKVLAWLDDGAEKPADAAIEAHLASCPPCREAVARLEEMTASSQTLTALRAPEALVARIKTMARFSPACERALELLTAALDGEIEAAERGELTTHLHDCRPCTAVWEALATLREAGRGTAAPARLRAACALHPSANLVLRRRRRVLDLRLATAAAYILAAATVVLIGDPARLARASSVGVEKASLYARAAVENRVESLTREAKDTLVGTAGWAADNARELWESIRGMVKTPAANQSGSESVDRGEKGGTS